MEIRLVRPFGAYSIYFQQVMYNFCTRNIEIFVIKQLIREKNNIKYIANFHFIVFFAKISIGALIKMKEWTGMELIFNYFFLCTCLHNDTQRFCFHIVSYTWIPIYLDWDFILGNFGKIDQDFVHDFFSPQWIYRNVNCFRFQLFSHSQMFLGSHWP